MKILLKLSQVKLNGEHKFTFADEIRTNNVALSCKIIFALLFISTKHFIVYTNITWYIQDVSVTVLLFLTLLSSGELFT